MAQVHRIQASYHFKGYEDKFGQWFANRKLRAPRAGSNRKADSYVKLNVKMADYYRIKDSAETENAKE